MRIALLGDEVELIRGVSFDGGEASSRERDGYAPILRAGNIADHLIVDENLVWVPETRISQEQWMRPGDIAICTSSGSPTVVGKSALLLESFRGSVGAFCAVVRPGSRLNPVYLAAWFRSPAFLSWRDGQARGASIQNLRLSTLANIAIPVPELTEQRRIAAHLTAQLAAVERARAAALEAAALIELAQGRTYQDTFRGVTPLAVGPAHEDAPADWRWVLLTDIARLESGHTPSRGRPDWWGGDIDWIALPDIRAVDGLVANKTGERTNPEGIAHSAARVLPTDTVVLSRTASVGFVTRMGHPMATSQDFVNWVCGSGLDPEFLMHLLIRSREYIRSLSSGAVHKTVYFPTVRAFRVCIPSRVEQQRITAELRERLATLDQLKRALEVESESIDALPAALLCRAFEDPAA